MTCPTGAEETGHQDTQGATRGFQPQLRGDNAAMKRHKTRFDQYPAEIYTQTDAVAAVASTSLKLRLG